MDHNGSVEAVNVSCKGAKQKLVRIGESAAPDYWKSVEELWNGPSASGEFPGGLSTDSSFQRAENTRRDFLSLMGFTVGALGALGLAGCRAPVQHAVPLLEGSDQIVPGVSNWYATTCGGCPSACSLLVKQRDGRPIKIEGNDSSTLFGGGTCATGQATVLSLYDGERLRGPVWKGQPAKWQAVDQQVLESLHAAERQNRRIVLLSGTINSPSTLEIVAEWSKRYPTFRHVVYDAVSLSALRAANTVSFGQAVTPHYSFDKAQVIVGLEADFLGTWLSPVEFARQYAISRRPEDSFSLHVQFESGFSVTGSNADIRVPVAPSEMGLVAVALMRRIAHKAGIAGVFEVPEPGANTKQLDTTAAALWRHRGESLVVSGSQDQSVQLVVNALNSLLGNIGRTVDLSRPSFQRNGDDAAMAGLVEQMNRGEIHTMMLHGVNPVHDYAEPEQFVRGLEKVALSVAFSDRRDETSQHVHAICPDHHFLEKWGDAEPVASYFSLAQPLIAPLFDTRSAQESLLKWAGIESDHYTYLRAFWRKNVFSRESSVQEFDTFWDGSLRDGVAVVPRTTSAPVDAFHGDWKTAARKILDEHERVQASGDNYELIFYESVAMRDGRHANNPWLQELPDPITKVTWGNYAAVAPKLARKVGLSEGDVVLLKSERGQVQLPVFIQPGQQEKTISVALGYGRRRVGKVGRDVGVNVFPLTSAASPFRRFVVSKVTMEKTGRSEGLATTQTHFHLEGRPIVLEVALSDIRKQPAVALEFKETMATLWPEPRQGEHSWGLAIDMTACTGCSACVVACQAENNIPVIGKDQVQRIRIMHWIRVDRYYSGPEENPASVHQPMMCQHCGHAPCETVCPVHATTTSSEGINQQVYNRCIGTRYCANNCPYKVRRFNWYNYTENAKFDFNMSNPLGRMVLNPDVVVRSRGVMEKCNLCVQRIQSAKNLALKGKRTLTDGDIKTACQQVCPTQAVVFGDLKDPQSRVSRLQRSQRNYQVLEELGTRPNVSYLKKVRNTTEA